MHIVGTIPCGRPAASPHLRWNSIDKAKPGRQCVAVGVATPGIVHDNGVLLVIPFWFASISKRELFDIDLKAQSLFAVFSRVLVGGEITLHEQH